MSIAYLHTIHILKSPTSNTVGAYANNRYYANQKITRAVVIIND